MGKILTYLFQFLMNLLKLCLPLNTDITSPKLEKASLTVWSLMNSGRRIVTKIGSFLFLRGPIRFRKLRQTSESPKRHRISVPCSFSITTFDSKTKTNFEGEILYRVPVSVTPSNSRIRKISDSRTFLWVSTGHTKWPSNYFSLLWATPRETSARLLQFASSLNQLNLAEDSPLGFNYNFLPKGE